MGRSNVGKSSLINALCERRALAKSSSTPGKTRLINFFDVEFAKDEMRYRMFFVDVPGFGYANVSKDEKKEWHKNLGEFLEKRDSIKLFLHLKDPRLDEQKIDMEASAYLRSFLRGDQKLVSVYTKGDKLNQKELGLLRKRDAEGMLVSVNNKKQIDAMRELVVVSLFGKNGEAI